MCFAPNRQETMCFGVNNYIKQIPKMLSCQFISSIWMSNKIVAIHCKCVCLIYAMKENYIISLRSLTAVWPITKTCDINFKL